LRLKAARDEVILANVTGSELQSSNTIFM